MLAYVAVNVAFSVSGKVQASITVRSIRLHEYLSPHPRLQVAMEVLLLLFTLAFAANELGEICSTMTSFRTWRSKLRSVMRYFTSLKNCHDWLIILVTLATVAVWASLLLDPSRNISLLALAHIDLEQVALLSQRERLLSGICLPLHAIGLFPFLEMSDQLSLVTRTIGLAMKDLPSFLVVFLAVLSSYAVIGHLLFGPHIEDWSSILGAYTVCYSLWGMPA